MQFSRSETVLLGHASGVLGFARCRSIAHALRDEVDKAYPSAILFDVRGALLALDEAEYYELLRHAICEPLTMRMAYVVGAALVPAARVHCEVMGRRNLPRKSFRRWSDAAEWVGLSRSQSPHRPGPRTEAPAPEPSQREPEASDSGFASLG